MRLWNTTSFAIINPSSRSSPHLKMCCFVSYHVTLSANGHSVVITMIQKLNSRQCQEYIGTTPSICQRPHTTLVIVALCESTKHYYNGKECHAMGIGYSQLECLHIFGDPGIVFVKVITTSIRGVVLLDLDNMYQVCK